MHGPASRKDLVEGSFPEVINFPANDWHKVCVQFIRAVIDIVIDLDFLESTPFHVSDLVDVWSRLPVYSMEPTHLYFINLLADEFPLHLLLL